MEKVHLWPASFEILFEMTASPINRKTGYQLANYWGVVAFNVLGEQRR